MTEREICGQSRNAKLRFFSLQNRNKALSRQRRHVDVIRRLDDNSSPCPGCAHNLNGRKCEGLFLPFLKPFRRHGHHQEFKAGGLSCPNTPR